MMNVFVLLLFLPLSMLPVYAGDGGGKTMHEDDMQKIQSVYEKETQEFMSAVKRLVDCFRKWHTCYGISSNVKFSKAFVENKFSLLSDDLKSQLAAFFYEKEPLSEFVEVRRKIKKFLLDHPFNTLNGRKLMQTTTEMNKEFGRQFNLRNDFFSFITEKIKSNEPLDWTMLQEKGEECLSSFKEGNQKVLDLIKNF
jgi:hypothetical protein